MLHNIDHMYRYIRKQETVQASLIIQFLHVNFKSTKAEGASPGTPNLYIPLQPKIPLNTTTVPEYLKDVHLRPSKVWNCDKIFFDPNE